MKDSVVCISYCDLIYVIYFVMKSRHLLFLSSYAILIKGLFYRTNELFNNN